MSKSSNRKRITRLLFVFVVSLALVCADLVVLAQNENTQDDTTRGGQMTSNTQTGNTSGNTGNTGTGARRRRGRRRSAANTNTSGDTSGGANMSTGDMSGNASMTAGQDGNANAGATVTTGGRRRRRGRRRSAGAGAGAGATANANAPSVSIGPGSLGETVDISGTFTGTINYPDFPGGALTGDATLTVNSAMDPATGTNFSLTSATGNSNGRAVAVVTRGYIAVTMMFGNNLGAPPAGTSPTPAPTVSLRLRRSGTRITLNNVRGEPHQFSFSSTLAGGSATVGGRRRRRRSRNRMSNMGDANMNANTGGGGEINTNTTNTNTTPPQ